MDRTAVDMFHGGQASADEIPVSHQMLSSGESKLFSTGKRKRTGGRRPRADWPAPYADVNEIKDEEFDRDDIDAADALFALANQQESRNLCRKLNTDANHIAGSSKQAQPVAVPQAEVRTEGCSHVKAVPIAVASAQQPAGLWLAQQQLVHDAVRGTAAMVRGTSVPTAQPDQLRQQVNGMHAGAFPPALLAAGGGMGVQRPAGAGSQQRAGSEQQAQVPAQQQAALQQHLQLLLFQTLAAQQRHQQQMQAGQNQQVPQEGLQQAQMPAHLAAAGAQQPGNIPLCMWVPSKALQNTAPGAATLADGAAQATMVQGHSAQQQDTGTGSLSLFSQHTGFPGTSRGGTSGASNRETAVNGPSRGGNTSSESGPSIHERGARHVYISRLIERASGGAGTSAALKNTEGTGSGGEEVTAENNTKPMDPSGGDKACDDADVPDDGGSRQGSGNNEANGAQLECTAGGSHVSGRSGAAGSEDECTESARGDEHLDCQVGAAAKAATAAAEPTQDGAVKIANADAHLPAAMFPTAPRIAHWLPSSTAAFPAWQYWPQASTGCTSRPPVVGQFCMPSGNVLQGLPVGAAAGAIPTATGPALPLQHARQLSGTAAQAMTVQHDAQMRKSKSSGEGGSEKQLEASGRNSGGASNAVPESGAAAALSASVDAAQASVRQCPSKQRSEAGGANGSPHSAAHQPEQDGAACKPSRPAQAAGASTHGTHSNVAAWQHRLQPGAVLNAADGSSSAALSSLASGAGSTHPASSFAPPGAVVPLDAQTAASAGLPSGAASTAARTNPSAEASNSPAAAPPSPGAANQASAAPGIQGFSTSKPGAVDSQMLASIMQAQGINMSTGHMGVRAAQMGFPPGVPVSAAGMAGMQVVTVPGANGQQAHVLIPVPGAYGMRGGMAMPTMMAPGAMGYVRGPQGQLLRPVPQQPGAAQQCAGAVGVPSSGAITGAVNMNKDSAANTNNPSAAGEKGSPANAADTKVSGAGSQLQPLAMMDNNGSNNNAAGAAVSPTAQLGHPRTQAQELQGLLALPAGAFGGAMGAPVMGGTGGLCFVPQHALPAGAQGLVVPGMPAQAAWMPQLNAAAAAGLQQKPLVLGTDYMQVQARAAQGAAYGMMWPQGRCV